jgi:hypothetical protein
LKEKSARKKPKKVVADCGVQLYCGSRVLCSTAFSNLAFLSTFAGIKPVFFAGKIYFASKKRLFMPLGEKTRIFDF